MKKKMINMHYHFFSSKILQFVSLKKKASSFFVWGFNHRVLCKFQEITVSEEESLN